MSPEWIGFIGILAMLFLLTLRMPIGIAMLLVGTVVGGLMALGLFAVTAFSLPMLLDRRVDFATAIITSIAAVRANGAVMLRWAALIGGLLLLAMLPLLGHATWHLYRRAIAA